MFSYEDLQVLVPKRQRHVITEEIHKKINDIAADPAHGDEFKEHMVTYAHILTDGKYSIDEYTNAINFVTLMLLGNKNIDSYRKTFPARYKKLEDRGLTRAEMASYVSVYKGGKLVTKILEQTMIPSYILNAPIYQEAINKTRDLMNSARSETVQQKAAETLINNLKAPEVAKLEVDIAVNRGEVVDDEEAFMRKVAEEKLKLMKLGGDVQVITNMASVPEVIEAEVV